MNRLIAVIPTAIVLIVAVSMGIGAALLGYPVWAIPLIALLGAGAPLLRFECSASEVSNKNFPVSSANWLAGLWRTPFCGRIAVC
jgi:hypothetical protein